MHLSEYGFHIAYEWYLTGDPVKQCMKSDLNSVPVKFLKARAKEANCAYASANISISNNGICFVYLYIAYDGMQFAASYSDIYDYLGDSDHFQLDETSKVIDILKAFDSDMMESAAHSNRKIKDCQTFSDNIDFLRTKIAE